MRVLVILGMLGAYLVWKFAANPEILVDQLIIGNPLEGEDTSAGMFILTPILGELIVFVFYWFKFNEWAGEGEAPAGFRPRPARHFTTWLRYIGWNTSYGLLMVAAYSLIVFFPDILFRLVESFSSASGNLQAPIPGLAEAQGLLAPLYRPGISPAEITPYAVMLTTVVWAGMRPFSEFEQRIRLRWQERAAIPSEAKSLVEIFSSDSKSFIPDDSIVEKVVSESEGKLSLDDFDSNNLSTDKWNRYARVEYLTYLLLRYNQAPVFSKLAQRYSAEFLDLKDSMLRLRERVVRRINDVHQAMVEDNMIGKNEDKPTLRESEQWLARLNENEERKLRKRYFNELNVELVAELERYWCDILQLIVCGVLAVGRSPVQRRYLLDAFGLNQKRQIPARLSWEKLTWVAGGALLIVFACSAIYHGIIGSLDISDFPFDAPKNMHEVLWWSFSACLMHSVAVVSGYAVQRSLDSQREELGLGKWHRPRRRDLIAEAAWAYCLGVSMNILLMSGLLAVDGKFADLGHYWWWALIPGVTAYFSALYTHMEYRPKQRREQPQGERIAYFPENQLIKSQSIATGIVALLVFTILESGNLWAYYESGRESLMIGGLTLGLYVTITSTVVGLALGRILSYWARTASFAGDAERRSDRQHVSEKTEWRRDEKDPLVVRLVSVSNNGAELECREELMIGSEGQIKIPSGELRRGRVFKEHGRFSIRLYGKRSKLFYIRFLDEVA